MMPITTDCEERYELAQWLMHNQEESGQICRFLEGKDSEGDPIPCAFCGRFESHFTEIREGGHGYVSLCKGFEARN